MTAPLQPSWLGLYFLHGTWGTNHQNGWKISGIYAYANQTSHQEQRKPHQLLRRFSTLCYWNKIIKTEKMLFLFESINSDGTVCGVAILLTSCRTLTLCCAFCSVVAVLQTVGKYTAFLSSRNLWTFESHKLAPSRISYLHLVIDSNSIKSV